MYTVTLGNFGFVEIDADDVKNGTLTCKPKYEFDLASLTEFRADKAKHLEEGMNAGFKRRVRRLP